jgi:hypothetical protein
MSKRHVIISGTGRVGSTFLVQLFTALGLDTGFSDLTSGVYSNCNAGMEWDIRSPDAPYLINSPFLCDYLDDMLEDGNVVIDHAIILVGDLFSAAESSRDVTRRTDKKVYSGNGPGGLWRAEMPELQESALALHLYKIINTMARRDVAMTLLCFPMFIHDPEYLYAKIGRLLNGINYDRFQEVFQQVARPELVHDFRPENGLGQPSGESSVKGMNGATSSQAAVKLQPQTDERDTVIIHLRRLLTQREETIQSLFEDLRVVKMSAGRAALRKLWRFCEQAVTRAPAPQNGDHLNGAGPKAVVSAESLDMTKALLNQSREELKELKGDDVRAIAFYLPQYHPIPENDQWWGKGFTEWTNVTKARPNFEGHYQPHLPADLGFYDLRVPEVREQQAELASEYGIHGFCYYHYWFAGRRLLERPFNDALSSGRPDFPFCLSWANENWTRCWDGAENEILLAQRHSDEDDRNFIRSLFPAFEDRRYIRINGKPLLLVYRANLLPNAEKTAAIWREEMKNAGLGEIYLCIMQSYGNIDPRPYGFDGAAEFPPHRMTVDKMDAQIAKINPNFSGRVCDYLLNATAMIHRQKTDYTLFKGVMAGWDNTPRRQDIGLTYVNSGPEAYEYWLGKAVEHMISNYKGDERIVFINAWNEWGEGAHLEPDRRYGHGYLESTRNVLNAVRGNKR